METKYIALMADIFLTLVLLIILKLLRIVRRELIIHVWLMHHFIVISNCGGVIYEI